MTPLERSSAAKFLFGPEWSGSFPRRRGIQEKDWWAVPGGSTDGEPLCLFADSRAGDTRRDPPSPLHRTGSAGERAVLTRDNPARGCSSPRGPRAGTVSVILRAHQNLFGSTRVAGRERLGR